MVFKISITFLALRAQLRTVFYKPASCCFSLMRLYTGANRFHYFFANAPAKITAGTPTSKHHLNLSKDFRGLFLIF
jgi:hypothetical protein